MNRIYTKCFFVYLEPITKPPCVTPIPPYHPSKQGWLSLKAQGQGRLEPPGTTEALQRSRYVNVQTRPFPHPSLRYTETIYYPPRFDRFSNLAPHYRKSH